jgi:hypothetical protein
MFLKILGMLAILLSFSSGAKAQCDDLEPEESIYGYRERGGRCEGFYNSNVSGFTMQIVSLTQGAMLYALNSNESLRIATKPLNNFDFVSVRGVNFSMNRNYRLDLALEAGSAVYIPVKDVLQPNNISPEKLGVFGFVEKSGYKYYVPVIPMSLLSGKIKDREKLNLQLISNIDIKRVTWRHALSQNDRCGKYSELIELPNAAYPRNTPIGLDIPANFLEVPDDEVIVCVQINIQAANGMEFNENVQLLIPRSLKGA